MNEFRLVRAWSNGLLFFAGRAGWHALLLIGLGVGAPLALQFALLGGPAAFLGVAAPPGGMSGTFGAGAAVLAAMGVGYVFQFGSYFGSLRLGLARHSTVGGAAGYGLLAGLIAIVGTAIVATALGLGLALGTPSMGVLAAGIVSLAAMAAFLTFFTALLAVGAALVLTLAMIFGAATGNVGLAATLVGGSGFVVVIALLVAALLLWLSARLSCTVAVMAERRSLNPFAAIAESWRLTWEAQLRIMGYLALLGLASVVLLSALAILAGVAVAGIAAGQALASSTVAAVAGTFAVGVPFACLAVLVPAGIYRELAATGAGAAEVFA